MYHKFKCKLLLYILEKKHKIYNFALELII